MKPHAALLVTALIIPGCNGMRHKDIPGERWERYSKTAYAGGFEIVDLDQCKMLRVHDPWQQSSDLTFSYILAENRALVPDSLSGLPFIRIPVERVIALSTTHVAMIHHLGMDSTIVGASGTDFIYSPAIRSRIDGGEIAEVGYDQGLNYETIVDLDPDVLFIYGVESSVRATSDKLSEMEVHVVFCGEYLETHPLGKAEWIRFFASFYGLEEVGDRMFRMVDSSYTSLAAQVSSAGNRPQVFTGLPWNDSWFVAGGRSYAARLIEDAGGTYLWNDHPSAEAVPMDLESVFVRAVDADAWINPGAARSLEELILFDARFEALESVRNGNVFNNDRRLSAEGGNDYWESGTVRPDLVLSDLIALFHPELMSEHQFIYYRKLK